MGLSLDLACALPTRGVPSSSTYNALNWQNNNVKQCGLCYHNGSIPDLAALVPVPDGLSVTCMVVPNVLHPWTSGEFQTQNRAVHVHSHLLSPCSGQSGVPCQVSVCALSADAFGMILCVVHKPVDHIKPHLKSPQTHRAPPTFVVLPSIWPQTPQAAAGAGEKKTCCHDHLLWLIVLSQDVHELL